MPGAPQRGFRFEVGPKRSHPVGERPLNNLISYHNIYERRDLTFFVFIKIVDKALEEPKYSQLYAQLCLRLAEDAPSFEDSAAENQTTQKQNNVKKKLSIAPEYKSLLFCRCVFSKYFFFYFTDLQKASDFQASR